MFGLFILMFILTLIVETPLLRYLYRLDNVDWPRAIKLSFSINFCSYVVVLVTQFCLFFAYMGYADIVDKRTPKKWNNISLLNGESGAIYFSKYTSAVSNRSKVILKRYDIPAN